MARWIFGPVIGDGSPQITPGQEETTGPFRPLVASYATSWQGAVIGGRSLVRATEGDLVAADADNRLTVFPDLAMGDVLTLAQRNWLINKCNALGEPSGWVVAGITFGQALRTIGRWLNNNFETAWLGN